MRALKSRHAKGRMSLRQCLQMKSKTFPFSSIRSVLGNDEKRAATMDFSGLSENEYAVVIADRHTGIVLNPDTLERWSDRSGGRNRLIARSFGEAESIAQKIFSAKAEIEAVIYDCRGKSVRAFR